ncbi:extracellular solute-binding protein [Georgenia thermotolerans]|uniref:Extracellular solute-binding protein n=1 Tax=Georgenia thermotolerans TaxID=527326 RepID=A0A7J5URC4_9MICO|nr:extracellular solute-binding protein [Georgenia thermotolerans]KAE8764423.1 extracellular solute-binding protein [Georgenia thermotolerans]
MSRSVRPKRVATGVAVLATAALALAACTPGSNTASDQTSTGRSPSEVVTDISKVGDQTLTVWDQEVRGGQNEQMERLNAAFEEKYPNITIKRVKQSTDDLNTTLRLALTGNDAPDVTQANNSRSQMGQYVAAGQLVSLDPYAEAYGWKDRFSPSVLQYTSFSPDGKTWGEGSVYGLPQVGEIVGVFYSKSKLAELGLEVPQTWADFEGQLQKIKDAGQTPLLLGNIEQWPALHVFGPIQGATVPADQVRTLGFGNKGASWTSPENVKAATTIQDWAKKGYFNEGFNGTDYDAAWKSLTEGKGVYLMGGSWLAADLQAAMGDDVGFFAPPPVEAGQGPVTTGGTGIPFSVTSKAKDPDVAAAYVNFITSDDAMKVLAETGNMPVVNTAAHTPPSGVQADVFQAYGDATEKGQLLPYLDNATPTMNTTIGQALQSLMAGQSTPQQFTETVEKDYADFVASNG